MLQVFYLFVLDKQQIFQFLLDGKKKYRAELTLGLETDTEDIYGTITKKSSIASTKDEIEKVILSFIGTYDQIPPMYSALKVNGKKLYELAREGIEIERKSRKVTIYGIDIININNNKVMFDVLCSKGTYIRTLCKDIGNVLGCGGVMSFLLRTEASGFDLNTAITIEELQEIEDIKSVLLPLDFPLNHMPKVIVKSSYAKQALNGNRIFSSYLDDELDISLGTEVRIYLEEQFIGFGIVKFDDEGYNYIKFLRLLIERE